MRADAPIVVAVSIFAVGCFQWEGCSGFEVHQPQVTLLVPNGEIAIIHQIEHEVLAVVGRTWPCQALVHLYGIEDCIDLLTELAFLRIETDATKVVLLLLVIQRIGLLESRHVIDGLSIR